MPVIPPKPHLATWEALLKRAEKLGVTLIYQRKGFIGEQCSVKVVVSAADVPDMEESKRTWDSGFFDVAITLARVGTFLQGVSLGRELMRREFLSRVGAMEMLVHGKVKDE